MNFQTRSVYFLGFVFLFTACSSLHSLKKNPSAKELFQHAEKLKKESYYKEALSYFKQFKSRFLYSRLAKEADLAIADIYFAQKEWPKAVRAYGQFFELYPQHPQSDKALLNLALSYFHQLPRTEDRDLSLSSKALTYLNQHLKFFPKSAYHQSAKEYKQKILKLLARQQWMIARFHIKQGNLRSAQPYMRNLKQKYSFLLPSAKKPTTKKKKPYSPLPLIQEKPQPIISPIRNLKGTYSFLLPSAKKPIMKKKKPHSPLLPSLQKLKQLEKTKPNWF